MSNIIPSRMFEQPAWFEPDEVEEVLSFFPELSKLSLYSVAGTLGSIERLGKVPGEIARIFEFGSGLGEGLVSLDMFARHNGRLTVTGSERTRHDLHVARQVADILEQVDAVEPDGISALAESTDKFDIILANMFGPSYDDERMPAEVIPVALGALTESGIIIINSDMDTMANVHSWAQKSLKPGQVEAIGDQDLPSGLRYLPHAIISKHPLPLV